jgi:hypothetical protein
LEASTAATSNVFETASPLNAIAVPLVRIDAAFSEPMAEWSA